MLCSTHYAHVFYAPLAKHGVRTSAKEPSPSHAHASHLSLSDEVVHAKKDCNNCYKAVREWQEEGKCQTDSKGYSYPHHLRSQKSTRIWIQQCILWLFALK